MDEQTSEALSRYLNEVSQLPNESAKTHRFVALIGELFRGTRAVIEVVSGVEKAIRIDTAEGSKARRVDAYFGNAVIEFEKSLKATLNTAKRQLREYSAGVWTKEGKPYRTLLCVATDGVHWRTFLPKLRSGIEENPTPDDVELEALQSFEVTQGTLREFWFWLTGFLFRESQTLPTAERFKFDFGAASPVFADAMETLRAAWKVVGKHPEPNLAFDTWKKYLTVTYGQLGDQEKRGSSAKAALVKLFLKHSYLASVARFLIWASLSGGRSSHGLSDIAKEVLSGDFFRRQNIENLVEDDFFQWVRSEEASKILSPVWERTLAQMQTYDLTRLNQDVLKGIYQELVDPQDRHDLGEYYTPEWLCERIVHEMLPQQGYVSVLDPTCGSGSFLRATIAHFLEANQSDDESTTLTNILQHIVGIDIHPLAVTIAKATYVLAVRTLVQAANRPIQIPVYLADALFLPREVTQLMFGEVPGVEIRFGKDRRVSIPDELIEEPDLFDAAIAACAKVAIDQAESGKETAGSLRNYLERVSPRLSAIAGSDAIFAALWLFMKELSEIIRDKQNSIWAFIVRNAYRPAMLRGRFDFILGNPPWLSYRYIADPEYQEEVKRRAVKNYAVAPDSKKLMTQMELATVFLIHALTTFGREGSRLSFVMPRSILSSDQHTNLRTRRYKAPVSLDGYWDMMEVHPLFRVPCCVIFGTKTKQHPQPSTSYSLPACEWSGRLPDRDISWDDARPYLSAKNETAKVLVLGERNAFSTSGQRMKLSKASVYQGRFRQGATIVPRSFYFVKIEDLKGEPSQDRLYWAETDEEQARTAKKPYDAVKMSGHVEGRFIFSTAISKHVLPFAVLPPASVVLPIIVKSGKPQLRTAAQLKNDGYRDIAKWMQEAERIWIEKRAGKAERQSVYERLDYSRELTTQNLKSTYIVLYNASGTDICAAAFDRTKSMLPFVVDHKLYAGECDSLDEADYVAAILNAPYVNKTIKPFQSMGLQGERDIHKKVLELPIPVFDNRDAQHKLLAELGARARAEAESAVGKLVFPKSLGGQRRLVRQTLASVIKEIDREVKRLLAGS